MELFIRFQFIEPRDWLYMIILLLVLYAAADWFKYKYYSEFERKYFFRALTIKIFGGILVGMVYQYFYGGGDTAMYSFTSNDMYDMFFNYPDIGMKVLTGLPNEWYDTYKQTYSQRSAIMWPYFYTPNEPKESAFLLSKYAFFTKLFVHKSYLSNSVIFSAFSFVGLWLFYQVVLERYPDRRKYLFYAFFCVPSVSFWGSGVLKDCVTLGGMGFVVAGYYRLIVLKKFKWTYILWIVIGAKIIIDIKVYILLALLMPLVVWSLLDFQKLIKNPTLKRLSIPILLVVGGAAGGYAVITFSKKFGKFAVNNVINTAKETQLDLSGKGSYSGTAIKTNAYLALFNGVFRPLPHDIRNPFIAISATENTIVLWLFILVLRRNRFKSIVERFRNDSFLMPALLFIFLFGYMVGFSTPNLGALVRYKIPLLPFLGILIAVFYVRRKPKQTSNQLVLS